jgi:hypothetical protein
MLLRLRISFLIGRAARRRRAHALPGIRLLVDWRDAPLHTASRAAPTTLFAHRHKILINVARVLADRL